MKLDTKEFETKMNKSIAAYNEACLSSAQDVPTPLYSHM